MVSIKHNFESEKSDSPTAEADGQVLPSHWNEEHNINLSGQNKIVGRTSADAGPAEEIDLDTDTSLTADADDKIPSQKAVKTYADTKIPLSYLDTDTSLTANSDSKIPSQKAIKTYVDNSFAANNAMIFRGGIDASSNPNYPSADAGDTYKITVAGKIGGGSGPNVEVNDTITCTVDSTSSGNHATVGSNWIITQGNVDGAVVGPASATNGNFPALGPTGKVISDSGYSPSSFQAVHANLSALAGLTFIADRLPYANGSGTLALATFTSFARNFLDDADASTALTTLGVSAFMKTLLDDATAADALATLGLDSSTVPLINYGGMNFNGSTTYLDTNALTGIADGKKGTLAVCVRFANTASATEVILDSTGAGLRLQRLSDGRIQVLAENVGNSGILSFRTAAGTCSAAGTYYILASWDLASAGSGRLYVNDVSDYNETTFTNDTIDYTEAEYSIGATVGGGSFLTGDIYSVWFDATNNIDFSVATNRRKFHDIKNIPLFVGKNGELPTGSKPILFLGYASGSEWSINRGSSTTGFWQNGTIAAPSTAIYGQYMDSVSVDEIADSNDHIAQQWMEMADIKAAPVDYFFGCADSFKTSTRIDLANSSWMTYSTGYIANSGTGGPLVPLMTSNSAPSGTVTASSSYGGGYEGYRAFDQSQSNSWMTTAGSTGTLEYQFPASKTVSHYSLRIDGENTRAPNTWTLQGYNGSGWDTLDSRSGITWVANEIKYFALSSNQTYTRFRINVTATNGGGYVKITQMQYYLGECPVTPIMTSNSAPYGTWTYSHDYPGYSTDQLTDGNFSSYWSTNVSPPTNIWARFTLGSSMTIGSYDLGTYPGLGASMPQAWTLWYHNGSTWVQCDSQSGQTSGTWPDSTRRRFTLASPVTSPTGAFEIRISAGNGGNIAIAEMQFYTPSIALDSDIRTVAVAQGQNPNLVDVYVLVTQIDGLTLGTDIKIYATRNNGTTWTEGTYKYIGHTANGTYYKARVNVSGQSASNMLAARVTTHNSKRMNLLAVAMLAK